MRRNESKSWIEMLIDALVDGRDEEFSQKLTEFRGLLAKERESNSVLLREMEPYSAQTNSMLKRLSKAMNKAKRERTKRRLPVEMDYREMLLVATMTRIVSSYIVEQEFERSVLEIQEIQAM